MSPLSLELSLAVLIGAIGVDFVFGEPRKYIHPSTVVRKVANFLDPYIRMLGNRYVGGLLFVLAISAIFAVLVYGLLLLTTDFVIAYVLVAIVLFKGSFSITSIGHEINPVVKALEEGRIEEARTFASRIIKRDTTGLDAPGVSSAVIETISVSLLNDVFVPLFYFSIFGIVGAFVSRVVNILDTLVGQKNRKNYQFGKWPAIIHTVVNYIPAKILSFFIMLGSELWNYRVSSVSFMAARAAADSPNNGWAMGAMASSLNLRLEKVGYYVLNENGFEPSVGDIKRALRTYYMSFYVFLIIYVIPMMLVFNFLIYPMA